MSRLFWLGVGVAAGVLATRKANQAAHAATPAGIGANVGEGLRELATAIGSFGAEVRAGMVEREHELQETVERQTGHTPGRRARRAND
ncbi:MULTISPECIES: hypothetical protein [Actinosynnema]|uniref:Secreted protein n=3 Tax=Actinosynnema TaxID=40566 RepID=C6W915_ACTMD|nr:MULTISPECIES: hypothetical protein [Actinosynnema]AXX32683.1 hypothetical protein APASM_5318 [Actinosynnema pretiosum subsp. pretiosum]ACU39087.1 hypothetical protein Amir_5266 [Actinosynnema mirum DSM 43827]ATE56336.1 hypothetical protein CNX65_26215 [Actinosynnema pretiosum]MCP2099583.1 hypothetical protein [Actinosynnema pretiosum]QUF03431.1 hypothetical protein KCV87_29130 [Actinosynnema pretiosum subsp. pretiosum]